LKIRRFEDLKINTHRQIFKSSHFQIGKISLFISYFGRCIGNLHLNYPK